MGELFSNLGGGEAFIALLTLTGLEVVLGIDNIIFITILASRLPVSQQARARNLGLLGALVMRILLLLTIKWMMGLTRDLFDIFGNGISGKDIILILGGLFLIGKAAHELHNKLEGEEGHDETKKVASFWGVIVQIMLIDIVFSLDSVITAVGMVKQLWVMITAVVISIGFMLLAAGKVSAFVERHPTVKILALAFLILIGVNLIADGFGHHLPKGYTYFSMAFALGIEMLNIRFRKKAQPIHLRNQLNLEEEKLIK